MSMHNEAERLRVLAEKLDPVTGRNHAGWVLRQQVRDRLLPTTTPGALLGAAVDLFDFALAGEGGDV